MLLLLLLVYRLADEQEQCTELSAELQRTRAEWQSEGGQLREEVTRLTSEFLETINTVTFITHSLVQCRRARPDPGAVDCCSEKAESF